MTAATAEPATETKLRMLLDGLSGRRELTREERERLEDSEMRLNSLHRRLPARSVRTIGDIWKSMAG